MSNVQQRRPQDPAALEGSPHWPLSGDVTQDILPWTWWLRFMGQFGLININYGRTADPALERRILDEVGSYGRQLGRISEALDAVIDATCEKDGKLDREKLSDDDIRALLEFRELVEATKRLKRSA